jgi:hypothetical protein
MTHKPTWEEKLVRRVARQIARLPDRKGSLKGSPPPTALLTATLAVQLAALQCRVADLEAAQVSRVSRREGSASPTRRPRGLRKGKGRGRGK